MIYFIIYLKTTLIIYILNIQFLVIIIKIVHWKAFYNLLID